MHVHIGSQLLSAKEVASLFHVNVQTIRKWRREGELKAAKIGKAWLFEREYIEHYVKRRTRLDRDASARKAMGLSF